MRNRLFTLCLLFYPRAQRARDGETLRDLALELSECGGATREAVGLVRGGVGARWQRYVHAVPNAPWGEALRKLALPLAVLNVANWTFYSVSIDNIDSENVTRLQLSHINHWLLYAAASALLTLVGVSTKQRSLTAIGALNTAVSSFGFESSSSNSNPEQLLAVTLVPCILLAAAFTLRGGGTQGQRVSFRRMVPCGVAFTLLALWLSDLLRLHTPTGQGFLVCAVIMGYFAWPAVEVVESCFSIRRNPSKTFATTVLLTTMALFLEQAFVPSSRSILGVPLWIVIFIGVIFAMLIAAKAAGEIADSKI